MQFCLILNSVIMEPDSSKWKSFVNTTSKTMWCNYSSIPSLQWASYQIRKIAGCACAGNAGNVFPRRRLQKKPLVSDPGMHHGTCVTHVTWCMSGSLNRGGGENVPGIPGACAPAILRIWQETHGEGRVWISDNIPYRPIACNYLSMS